jgi:hypothetical protein
MLRTNKPKSQPSVDDVYLQGNIGSSQLIQPFIIPPAPPEVASNPSGVVVAQVEVVGGDPVGVPLTINLRISSATFVGTQSLQGTVEWGSGGFQPASLAFDLRRSQIIQVQGSWARVKVINSGTIPIDLAAFVTIGTRTHNTDPVSSSAFGVGVGASGSFPLPQYVRDVQIETFNPTVDTYDIEFVAGGLTLYKHNIVAGSNGSRIVRIAATVDTVKITNLGAAQVNGFIIFGLQL